MHIGHTVLAKRVRLMTKDTDILDNVMGHHSYTHFPFKILIGPVLTSISFFCFRNKNAHVIFSGFNIYSLSSIFKMKSLILFVYLSVLF
jgi:hypothetical protein